MYLKCSFTIFQDTLIFLQVLTSISKENFQKCSPYLHPEAVANFNNLISQAEDVYNCGKERIKLWHLCLAHIQEVEKLIHCSSEWLKREFENSKDHPCPKQDLPIYITFFKVTSKRKICYLIYFYFYNYILVVKDLFNFLIPIPFV